MDIALPVHEVLYESLRGLLHVASSVTPATGRKVNVGEAFTLHLTVTNKAVPKPDGPYVVFSVDQVLVDSTAFASFLIGPPQQQFQVQPSTLFEGQSGSVDIEMRADKDWPDVIDPYLREFVASVVVDAYVDLSRLARIRSHRQILSHEIHEEH